jgi:hypothetical protein
MEIIPNRLSPNSHASQPPPNHAKPALTSEDHKAAVMLLQQGQTFSMDVDHIDVACSILNEERKEAVTIFFAPSNGVDSHGTLQWVPADAPRMQSERSRTFDLNPVQPMRAGSLRSPIPTRSSRTGHAPHGCTTAHRSAMASSASASKKRVYQSHSNETHRLLIAHHEAGLSSVEIAALMDHQPIDRPQCDQTMARHITSEKEAEGWQSPHEHTHESRTRRHLASAKGARAVVAEARRSRRRRGEEWNSDHSTRCACH